MVAPLGFRALPLPLAQLSLAAVLKCGQSFRWSVYPLRAALPSDPSHEYRLCLQDRVVCLRQSPDTLFYRSVFPDPSASSEVEAARDAETLLWLDDYFQLDVDLAKLYNEWSERIPFEGIRMLRQDPWENLISFICSSNNNITRITKMVKSLCAQYSPPLLSIPLPMPTAVGMLTPSDSDGTKSELSPFPPPSLLSSPDVATRLRSLGFGYRADFIQKTARMLEDAHERWLYTLRDMTTADARHELLKLMGVVVNLDKPEVIPVDTHVHQIVVKHYGFRGASGTKQAMSPKLYDAISEKFYNVWGAYAGWAHSVLFTADLKAFSDYGLLTPTPLRAKLLPLTNHQRSASALGEASTDSGRFGARNALRTEDNPIEASSLAERVKKRRRASRGPS
ncbi:DNA glycosylase [Russula brevipes]|nr:DNA glycosylase [Russula brevipes]